MRLHVAIVVCCLVATTACDTGDGTTLRSPAADALPVAAVPIGTVESSAEAVAETLASVPLETAAPTTDPNAPTLPAPDAGDEAGEIERFSVTAPWPDGGVIDPRYGCDGSNAAPPLAWTQVPDDAVEIAIAFENESDVSRGRPFIHWVVTGLDPTRPGLAENELPEGSVTGLNFFGNVAYDGPCPVPGDTDVHRLTVFVLNQQLEVAEATPAAEVLDAIRSVAFDQASIVGSSTR